METPGSQCRRPAARTTEGRPFMRLPWLWRVSFDFAYNAAKGIIILVRLGVAAMTDAAIEAVDFRKRDDFMRIAVAPFLCALVLLSSSLAFAGGDELVEKADVFYDKGDYAAAAKLYREAATAGSSWAMLRVGVLCEHGWGVPQSYRDALEWYERGAKAGED